MDIRLNVRELGQGKPLILLHGNGGSAETFQNQMEPFSRYFHVYAVDTRGHGLSPRGSGPFTLRRFAEDLRDFMDQRGIEKACLLGFSDGGNIALLFAARYPQRVERLVINGANLFPSGMCFVPWMRIDAAFVRAWFRSLFDQKAVPGKELLGLMALEPHIRKSALQNLRMPVLILSGTKDMIRPGHTLRMSQKIPGAELCLLPGGHDIVLSNSVSYNNRVLTFLRENKSDQGGSDT